MNKLIITMLISGLYLLVDSLGWIPHYTTQSPPKTINRHIASATTSTPNKPADKSFVGTVVKTEGEAFIISNEEKYAITEGITLSEYDTIITSDKSFLSLTMSDKTKISVGGNSKLKLTKYPTLASEDKEVTLDLSQGLIRTEMVKEIKNGYFKINTPDGEIRTKKGKIIAITKKGATDTIALDGFLDIVRFKDDQFFPIKGQEKIIITDTDLGEIPRFMDDLEFDYYRNKFLKNTNPSNLITTLVNEAGEMLSPIMNLTPNVVDENTLSFDDAMDQIKDLPEPELENIIRSPFVSAEQKELLVEASPLEDKTNLLELVKEVINQTEYVTDVSTLIHPAAATNLTIEQKEVLLDKVATSTVEKALDFIQDDVAAVLITPDNKVVFFEDHPELKADLPTNEAGEIIGIQVDENLVPIETVQTEGATAETISQVADTAIPVVGPTGEIIMLPVLNTETQELVIAPTDVTGEVSGVNVAELEVVVKPLREVQAVVTKTGVIMKGDDAGGGKTAFEDLAEDILIIKTNGKR